MQETIGSTLSPATWERKTVRQKMALARELPWVSLSYIDDAVILASRYLEELQAKLIDKYKDIICTLLSWANQMNPLWSAVLWGFPCKGSSEVPFLILFGHAMPLTIGLDQVLPLTFIALDGKW